MSSPKPFAGVANPWVELSADTFVSVTGQPLCFCVPAGAGGVRFRWAARLQTAELQFVLPDGSYCARVRFDGDDADISGLYYRWEPSGDSVSVTETVTAPVRRAADGERRITAVSWYETARRRGCSLSRSGSGDAAFDAGFIRQLFRIAPSAGKDSNSGD